MSFPERSANASREAQVQPVEVPAGCLPGTQRNGTWYPHGTGTFPRPPGPGFMHPRSRGRALPVSPGQSHFPRLNPSAETRGHGLEPAPDPRNLLAAPEPGTEPSEPPLQGQCRSRRAELQGGAVALGWWRSRSRSRSRSGECVWGGRGLGGALMASACGCLQLTV